MFKIKGSMKGLSNQQDQRAVGSEKKLQLASNDDLINRQEVHGMRYTQHQESTGIVRNNSRMVRKRSVRDASGIVPTLPNSNSSVGNSNSNGTILNDNSKVGSKSIKGYNNNPRQLGSSNTITPNSSTNIPSNTRMLAMHRPLTSNNPNRPLNNKSRLLNRKGTGIVKRQGLQVDKDNEENREESQEYISNEQMQQMIEEMILTSVQCQQLKNRSQELYEQVKEKLLANSGILVLKWYKIIQDRLYNQVVLAMNAGEGHSNNSNCNNKNNNNNCNNSNSSNNYSPTTISQLITIQLDRHLHKQTGLLSIQEKCSSQQQKLSSLINQRLSKLQSYLKPQTVQ